VALPQQLPPNDDNTNLPTQYHHHNGYGYNSNPGVMMVSNAEIDHNLRIGAQGLYYSISTILTAINNIIAHTLAVIFYGTYDDAMEDILRVFTIGLCLLVILIEMNRSILVQQSFVFQHWAARGVLYIFWVYWVLWNMMWEVKFMDRIETGIINIPMAVITL
jgi:hypothetical protein